MEPFSDTFVCFKCKHKEPGEMGCKAFPMDIPDEITSGENDHSKPLPGQGNDIVFEPRETEADAN